MEYNKRKKNKEDIEGKEELNMAEYPLQYLNKNVPAGQKTIEWQGSVINKKGEEVPARWQVTGSDSVGLPRYRDKDVLLGLMYYWKLQGFSSPELIIENLSEFMNLIKWYNSAEGYRSLELSLQRLVGATIVAENCFWDRSIQDYVKFIAFHILDEATIYKEGKYNKLRVKASRIFWNSIQEGNLKTINLTFYFSLDTPTSKALYSYLDKKAYANDEFTIDLVKLASHIGVNTNQALFHIKQVIKEASTELVNKGFLSSFVFKKSDGGELINFIFNKEYRDPEFLKMISEREKFIKYLIDEIVSVVGKEDLDSIEEIARSIDPDSIFRILGEVRELEKSGNLKTSKLNTFKTLSRKFLKEKLSLPFVK